MVKLHIAVRGGMFGDEGKGVTVAYLTAKHNAKLVVRDTGGSNAGHNVIRKDGAWHCFNQFGSGTFEGADTYLAPTFRVDPLRLIVEAAHLQQIGIKNPLSKIAIHENCLIITPYHVKYSQEQAAIHQRGTTGSGTGAAYRLSRTHPDEAIYARDLHLGSSRDLMVKLFAQQKHFGDFNTDIFAVHQLMYSLGQQIRIVTDDDWLLMRQQQDTIIYEGSQGYWLDRYAGFKPHVTSSDVTFVPAMLLAASDVGSWFTKVLCLRTYATRHGVGVFPTEDYGLKANLPEHHNREHAYQGEFRVGWFDANNVNQAIEALKPDYISLSHVDYVARLPEWRLYLGQHEWLEVPHVEYVKTLISYLNAPVKIWGYGARREDHYDEPF